MKRLFFLATAAAVTALMVAIVFSPVLADWAGIPTHVRLTPGSEWTLDLMVPFQLIDATGQLAVDEQRQFIFRDEAAGRQSFSLNLWGLIPVRDMVVEVVPKTYVYPGGQSIGVLLTPEGLVINQLAAVTGLDGRSYSPAADAGLVPGDVLVSIEGTPVQRPEDVSVLVNQLAEENPSLTIEVLRSEILRQFTVTPVLAQQEDYQGRSVHRFLLGLYLEDPAAGVGTLSFYESNSGLYGALGHRIANSLGQTADIQAGTIVQAAIDSIKRGVRGYPGEKLGSFRNERDVLGTIEKNSEFGIYGHLQDLPNHPLYAEPIPVGFAHQVEVGPAEILTVLKDDVVEAFTIKITKIANQRTPSERGLILQITDPDLLARTGGIIQGMSGSPIIQNDRLVGVVTHVFVHDPTRGYGGLIEWMLHDCGLLELIPAA